MVYTVTLADLRAGLRNRLNDNDSGNYTDAELDYCVNAAYLDLQVLTKCYQTEVAISLVNGTAAYACTPIFEVTAVYLGGTALEKASVEDLLNLDKDAMVSTGTPTHWYMAEGKKVRLYPIPSALDPIPACVVYGYGVAEKLTQAGDVPSAAPVGFDQTALLDRAEAEARKMRITYAGNAELVGMLMQRWRA